LTQLGPNGCLFEIIERLGPNGLLCLIADQRIQSESLLPESGLGEEGLKLQRDGEEKFFIGEEALS
jgi:hypothetical protein